MMIANERGVITVDYLFAMVLVMGFSFILFALSLTLTMTEVIQYVTYSSARNFYAGNMNPQEQQSLAFIKYQSLTQNEVLEPLLNGGWFELRDVTISSDIPNNKPELADYEQDPNQNLFHGTVVYFTSKVLDFSIPFYGDTANDDIRKQDEFGAYIGSYLGREVTQEECENLVKFRWTEIRNLDSRYSTAPDSNYVGIADNGC